jgi:hypothetical protein
MKQIIPFVCAATLLVGCAHQERVVTVEESRDAYRGQLAGSRYYHHTVNRNAQVDTTTDDALARRRTVMRNQRTLSTTEQGSYVATSSRLNEPTGTTVYGATEGAGAAQVGTISAVAPPNATVLTQPEPLPVPARPSMPEAVGERITTRTTIRSHGLPTASAVPGHPGYVYSPFSPNSGYVDVTGLAPGSQAKDPYTGRIFIVP